MRARGKEICHRFVKQKKRAIEFTYEVTWVPLITERMKQHQVADLGVLECYEEEQEEAQCRLGYHKFAHGEASTANEASAIH